MSELSPTIQLIFSIITAIGVIYAILRGVNSDSKDRDQNFAEMLSEFDSQLKDILEKEKELDSATPNADRCDRFASDYLNVLDRIAFLRELKKIDDDMIFYFDNHFAYGITLLQWKEVYHRNNSHKYWPHQVWWTNTSFNKKRIIGYVLTWLPKDMKILYNQRVKDEPVIEIPTDIKE